MTLQDWFFKSAWHSEASGMKLNISVSKED